MRDGPALRNKVLVTVLRLKEEAAKPKAALAAQTPPGNARVAYAFGATVGKRLKGLFGK